MPIPESDFAALCGDGNNLRRSVRKWLETIVVLTGLLGGGAGLGLWAGLQLGQEKHLAEIDRLRQAYSDRLATLSGKVSAAASTAAGAADTAAGAAAQADVAAITAQAAAQSAKQAATVAKDLKKP